MIFSWLVNSMELEIGQTYMYLSTAKQLWDAVNEMYSDLGNSLQVYELKTKIRNTTQGIMSVTSYYRRKSVNNFYFYFWKLLLIYFILLMLYFWEESYWDYASGVSFLL